MPSKGSLIFAPIHRERRMKVIKPSRKNTARNNKDKQRAEDILAESSDLTTGAGLVREAGDVKSPTLSVFSDEFETDHLARSSDSNKKSKRSAKSEYDTLMHRAIHLLSMREHSVKELQDKLAAKSEHLDTVLSVMDFMLENDYVSDVRFTEAFVRSKANKGHGPVKIRSQLRAKGINSSLIDDHLDANASIWFDNASLLYDKKYGEEPVSDYNTWSKRARFLQGRGFTMEHIQSTVPQVDFYN